MTTTMTYTGTLPPGVVIADGTDPWIEVGGVPVDWQNASPIPSITVDEDGCEMCRGSGTPMLGVVAPMNTPTGVQRCDECDLYDGDLPAALALAQLVGGVVRFEADQ